MKIINRTHWRTEHLRAFAQRVAAEELEPGRRREVTLIFEYTRGRVGGSSGRAWAGAGRAVIRVARNRPDRVDLTMILAHEMAHLRGLHHNHPAMLNAPRYHRTGNWREVHGWAAALPLEVDRFKQDYLCERWTRGWGSATCSNRARWEDPEGRYICNKHARAPEAGLVRELGDRLTPPAPTSGGRRQHIEAKVAEWARKAKSASTFLKKWTRRLRALEAREAAAKRRD